MEILAIETRFSPYFEKLICETDILERMQPLVQKAAAMAKRVMTPDTQRRLEDELAGLWRGIVSGLPPEHRPPFAAAEFFSAIRDGQMELDRLAKIVMPHATLTCPERLRPLGDSPEARATHLERVLHVMFERIARQGEAEDRGKAKPGPSQAWLAQFDRLPDLFMRARTSGKDVHAEQERLAREHDARQEPYRLSMPQRHPGRPCSSGEHKVPAIQYTLVNPARSERAELSEADVHEAREHGASLPAEVVRFLQGLGPAEATALPARLSFRFNSVQLDKDGAEMTLTIIPLWSDAQRAPPEGFEDEIQVFRLNDAEFAAFYAPIVRLDPARYARLTDADFDPTPPDLRHAEWLHYRVEGKVQVSWSRPDAWLKDPALRQPLLALEQQAQEWAKAHPAAALPRFE